MSEWKIKGAVEDDVQKSSQQEEQAVLDKAVEKGDIEPEAAGQEVDDVPKINLNDLTEETTEEVNETVEETVEQTVEDDNSPLELIVDEETAEEAVTQEEVVDVTEQAPEAAQQLNLPENVEKLVEFMQETGGSVEDFVKLNKNLDDLPDGDLLREYYRQSKPWDNQEIEEYLEDNFSYSEDEDDSKTIRSRKRAFKEELFNAKQFLKTNKDKYYADLKLRPNENIPEEYRQAYDYYSETQKSQEVNQKLTETFLNKTNDVFNENFKGFDFQVGDNKYRFKVGNVDETKTQQSDISNLINSFLNDKGEIDNAKGYHKAIFAARNADKLAEHFYEQGRADALRNSAKEAKNIKMDPRQEGVVKTKSGQKFRVVSGDSSSKLKIKLKK